MSDERAASELLIVEAGTTDVFVLAPIMDVSELMVDTIEAAEPAPFSLFVE